MFFKNYPNPFNQQTLLRYHLPQQSRVDVSIYNIGGEKLFTLQPLMQPAGYHTRVWSGCDHIGRPLASGIYFIHVNTKFATKTIKSI